MLERLRLTDLGVIVEADLDLRRGLVAITGETGAGKTMILSGLAMVLGAKVDALRVRSGATAATAEAEWSGLPPAAQAIVTEAGGFVEDDGVVAGRTLPADGRSRATLGGRTVPAGVLAELADTMVAIHGQAEQNRLRQPARQRDALDEYAGLTEARAAHGALWREHAEAAAHLAELERQHAGAAAEIAQIEADLEEIERVNPEPDEDAAIDAEIEKLDHIELLRTEVSAAQVFLNGEESTWEAAGASSLLEQARRSVSDAARVDPALQPLADTLQNLALELDDAAGELARYLADIEADPARLEFLRARRQELSGLMRRFGPTLAEVFTWSEQAAARLGTLDAKHVEGARESVAALAARRDASAAELTSVRQAAATRLGDAITAELASLAMGDARVEVTVTETTPGPSGQDAVTFWLRPSPASGPVPIADGASGGELSRIMLAVELSLAAAGSGGSSPATFVFDEVDAGVGGSAAVHLGQRLARLARSHQVIAVTHLAQVAAAADQHLVVTKPPAAGEELLASHVQEVAGESRIDELARMLSGSVTDTARAHAAELISQLGVSP